MNTKLLKSKLTALGLTQGDLAQRLNVSLATLNRKVNDPNNLFVLGELLMLKEILQLSNEEAINIFFRD